MRRKRRRNSKLLIFIIFLLLIGGTYARLQSTLNIKGNINIKSKNDIVVENKNFTIEDLTVSTWKEGNISRYQYNFYIKNISQTKFDNFILKIYYNSEIQNINIWNYDYKITEKELHIISNQDIGSKDRLYVNYIVSSSAENLQIKKIDVEVKSGGEIVDNSILDVTFQKTNEWGSYVYQYDLILINKGSTDINYWEMNIKLPENTTYLNGWNGEFIIDDSKLSIKSLSYNKHIKPNEKKIIGLQITTNIVNFIPNDYTVIVR